MPTIYKYQLHKMKVMPMEVAKPLQFLTIQIQQGVPTFWIIADTDAPKEVWNIHCYGTGWEIEYKESLIYLGTVQEGSYVWHYFYEKLK